MTTVFSHCWKGIRASEGLNTSPEYPRKWWSHGLGSRWLQESCVFSLLPQCLPYKPQSHDAVVLAGGGWGTFDQNLWLFFLTFLILALSVGYLYYLFQELTGFPSKCSWVLRGLLMQRKPSFWMSFVPFQNELPEPEQDNGGTTESVKEQEMKWTDLALQYLHENVPPIGNWHLAPCSTDFF